MSEAKESIIKKPGCGMNFNCSIVNFDVKLARLWHRLEYQLKDKLSEEDLGYISQAKYIAEDLVMQFYREFEIKKD